MAQPQLAALATRVVGALDMLGARASDPALDPLADPSGACADLAALGEGDTRLLRVASALGEGDEAFAPSPHAPIWLIVTKGSKQVGLVPHGAEDKRHLDHRKVQGVTIELPSRACCDAASCSLEKTHAKAWLDLGPAGPPRLTRLLVSEDVAIDRDAARKTVTAVATQLGALFGVPVVEAGEPVDAAPAPVDEGAVAPLSALDLSRFSLRFEGDTRVLRDHATRGPKSSVKRLSLTGFVLVLFAAAAWVLTARSVSGADAGGETFGEGALALVLTLTAYAFFGVARFAARYEADSAPLLSITRGRFVPLPWVARTGAVDRRPEGRFGAAIPIQELHGVAARERDGGLAIELDTDHGLIDALTTADPKVAAFWTEALRRALAADAHPAAGPTAKQRARDRARAPAAASR